MFTPFEFFLLVSGVIISVVALHISRRRSFNAAHGLVFFLIGAGLLVFTIFPSALTRLGHVVGLQRGADLLVYASIIFLTYSVLILLDRIEKGREDTTRLIREIAIRSHTPRELSGRIAFVMAAYNESKVIESTIRTLMTTDVVSRPLCIVVDDGSRDGTGAILDRLATEYPDLIALHHYRNRGQGAALETGFEYIRRYGKGVELVATYDADGQHQLSDLPKFFDAIESDPTLDIALGSRFLLGTPEGVPASRQLVLRAGVLFTWAISHIHLTDAHNGYRVMRHRALRQITITLDGMGHASEIVDIIARDRMHYREVPVTILYTDYSMAKGQSSSNAFRIARDILWKKFF